MEGYTVSNGRVFFPCTEPFGSYLYNYLVAKGVAPDRAKRYAFTELYDTTKTVARQIAEKNKYILTGQFKGSASGVISLGAYNVPQGSVVVTAGSPWEEGGQVDAGQIGTRGWLFNTSGAPGT